MGPSLLFGRGREVERAGQANEKAVDSRRKTNSCHVHFISERKDERTIERTNEQRRMDAWMGRGGSCRHRRHGVICRAAGRHAPALGPRHSALPLSSLARSVDGLFQLIVNQPAAVPSPPPARVFPKLPSLLPLPPSPYPSPRSFLLSLPPSPGRLHSVFSRIDRFPAICPSSSCRTSAKAPFPIVLSLSSLPLPFASPSPPPACCRISLSLSQSTVGGGGPSCVSL